MGLEGSIEEFGLADILQLIYFQKKTGILTVDGRLGRTMIIFLNGDIIGAESKNRLEDKRLGRILVKKGLITEEKLKEVLAGQKSSREKLGSALVKSNIVTKADIEDVIVNQMTETIVQLFNWKKGTYEFKPQKIEVDKDFQITIDTQHLLMEGLRIVDEWSVIEGKINLDTVFQKAEGKDPVELTPEETNIYKLIDGELDVSTIVELSSEDDVQVSRALVSLLDKGFLEPVEEKTLVTEREGGKKKKSAAIPVLAITSYLIIIISFLVSFGPLLLARQNTDIIEAEKELQRLRLRIETEKFVKGSYPETLESAGRDLRDPWGKGFFYRRTRDGYELGSAGPDGALNTPDDVY